MFPTMTFLLIALIKTPGEGGTVQIADLSQEACLGLGASIEQQFEAQTVGNGVHPTVIWDCVER